MGTWLRGWSVCLCAVLVSDAEDVDEGAHCYARDESLIQRVRDSHEFRMEFLRVLLDAYDHAYGYEMPDAVTRNSVMYLEENNKVLSFVKERIVPKPDGFLTLKAAKDAYKGSDHYSTGGISTLKTALQRALKTNCIEQHWAGGKRHANAFVGFALVDASRTPSDPLEG